MDIFVTIVLANVNIVTMDSVQINAWLSRTTAVFCAKTTITYAQYVMKIIVWIVCLNVWYVKEWYVWIAITNVKYARSLCVNSAMMIVNAEREHVLHVLRIAVDVVKTFANCVVRHAMDVERAFASKIVWLNAVIVASTYVMTAIAGFRVMFVVMFSVIAA